jgi:hypothetical protein
MAGGGCCLCCSAFLLTVMVVVLAWLAGLYMEELERFRTNTPGARWVNWIGDFSCGEGVTIERPTSVEELQVAIRRYPSVRAVATGHSFNPFACPALEKGGAVVDMIAFQRVEVIPLEAGRHFVRAEAGIKMGQLQNEILAQGLTLRVPPGNPAYTLGGCIATGCHNLGQSHAQDLAAVKLVLANGTILEVQRGSPDFDAAAVSLGRLGVILSVTLEVLPYRTLQWKAEQLPLPSTPMVLDVLGDMSKRQTSQETVGNKLVFYLATGVLMMEHWIPTGRIIDIQSAYSIQPYVNPQPFRVGQGRFSLWYGKVRAAMFGALPTELLTMLQVPAEAAFRGLHSSPMLSRVRKALGWQHSPEARGESSEMPTGNQYTWAGWVDEVTNLFMGLQHVEVIFPLEPKERAVKCLDAVFAHRHLTWWRLNVRTQRSEGFHISSTHSWTSEEPGVFLRVDFVAPGPLLDLPSGEASLTKQLHKDCPGWRKHWGKGLFATSGEEQWGNPEEFLKVVDRYDPAGKFKPRANPKWLSH